MTTLSLRDRFDRRVQSSADVAGCWLWTGCLQSMGYGTISINGKATLAHRVALRLAGVDVPAGAVVRHHCDVPNCVNPAHLAVGTHAENTADMMRRGRDGHGSVNGSAHPGAILTEGRVALLKLLDACGVKRNRLASLFGVSAAKVSQICLGQSWKHVPPLEVPA